MSANGAPCAKITAKAATRGNAGVLFFFILMTYHGIGQMLMNAHQTSSTMGIRMSIPYAALPSGFFVMFCVTLEQLLDFLNGAPMRGK